MINSKKALVSFVFAALITAPALANAGTAATITGKPCQMGMNGAAPTDSRVLSIGFATGQRGVPVVRSKHCRVPIDVQQQAIKFATGQHGMSMKSSGPCAEMDGMGVVTSVSDGKVTLQHEAVAGMPAMAMTFDVSNPALLSGLAAGDSVRFHLKASGDHYVIDKVAK